MDNVWNVTDYKLFGCHEQALNEQFCGSVLGKLFSVDYYLLAFVHHDSWTEIGEGHAVKVPIKVL